MNNTEVNEESGLSLLDIWHIIVKNLWLIIVSTIVVGACSGVYGFALKKPTYVSNASIMIQVDLGNSTSDASNAVVLGLRITETTKSLMETDLIAKKTSMDVYGSEDYYKTIQKGLTITSSTTNLMLPISYESVDRDNVTRILDRIINNTLELVDDEANNYYLLKDRLTIVDQASEATYASPNKKLIVLIGVVLGAIIGCVIAFIKELCSDRIIGKNETEEKVDIRVIGLVPNFDVNEKKSFNGRKGK